MARSFLIKAIFAVLLALLVTSSEAKRYRKSYKSPPRRRSYPINTCSKQHECVSISVHPVAPGPCNGFGCAFQACLTLNTGGRCDRNGGKIAGACTGASDQCCPTSYRHIGRQSSFTECQTGSPGSTLKFIIGDGKCNGKGLAYSVGGAHVTCGLNSRGCIRDACAWKVKLPQCPPPPPPPPAQLPTCAAFGPNCVKCNRYKCKRCAERFTLVHGRCVPCTNGCLFCKKVYSLPKPLCVLCANQGVVDFNTTSPTYLDCVGGTPPPGGVGAVGRRLSEFQTVDLL